jgi:hypothetical protein
MTIYVPNKDTRLHQYNLTDAEFENLSYAASNYALDISAKLSVEYQKVMPISNPSTHADYRQTQLIQKLV